MKHKVIFVLMFIGCYLICNCFVSNSKDKSTKSKENQPNKPFFEGYFYLQRLYPGVITLDNLKYSSSKAKLKYFVLNQKYFYFSNSAEDKTTVRGGIKLKRILDKKNDITKEGKCCNNLRYMDFSPKILQKSEKAPLFTKSNDDKEKKLSFKDANYCLELFAPFRARWRLCSVKPVDAYRLHLKIVFTLIKTTVNFKKVKSPVVIEKFFTNSKLVPEPVNADWNWETQKEWPGKCTSKLMQSPVKIIKQDLLFLEDNKFKLIQNLQNSYVKIERRYSEIIIKFKNDPGLIMLKYANKVLLYQPKIISFRFPGEHNILGKRFSGDMQINCEEISPNKTKRTNGLIFTIPMEGGKDYGNYKYFEGLAVDFWKFEVKSHGSYDPKDFISKRKLVFKLKDMMKSISEMKPTYYLYLGSQTTPPCEEYVYHLILGNPIKVSNCQIKILRDNSLASEEARQIHSRLSQNNFPSEYDDGKSDVEMSSDGIDGGSIYGKEDDIHEDIKEGVLELKVVPYGGDIYKYVEDKELRKKMLKRRLEAVKLSEDDAINC